ncbi:MAG: GGDEF domain-containing protein [Gammaproteobacteria bacterium]|nr:GGDEF domain-containing protein [Gammaproteobacteria bacterium]
MTASNTRNKQISIGDDLRSLPASTLQSFPIFRNTALAVVTKHLRDCRVQKYASGTLIITPDDHNLNVYAILKGQLSILHDNSGSEPLTVLGPGETVGEISVFDGQKPSAYVKATQDSELLVISREVLWDMIDDSHEISRNLLHILAKRIRSGNTTVLNSLQLQKQHEREAQFDALTGLHNRRWIDRTYEKHFRHSIEDNSTLCVIMIDIDHFKIFNDSYGHQAGDKVLQQVATAMKGKLRPNEIVARYGGEEFVILLPGVPAKIAFMISERVRSGVEACFYHDPASNKKVPITASLGIAQLEPGDSKESLLKHADDALYQAKQAGRNQTLVFKSF